MKKRWISLLTVVALLATTFCTVPFMGALAAAQRNLLQNADGTADAGKYGGWLTKYVYGAADAPGGNTLDLTGAAYAAAERDWDDEKPGKAVDGNTAAGTGDTFFMTLPDATDTQARLGLLVDLQKEYTLSRLSYFNNKYIAGGHRRYRGTVYAGNALNNLAKAATFDTYNNGDALQVDITLETTARYVFVAFNERNAFCSMTRKTGTFTGIALDEVQVWGGAVQRTVRFDYAGADSGDEEFTRTVENGAAVGTLPAPQKTGEEFLGWFDGNGVLWDRETVVTGDVTLTARWGQNLIGGKAEAWFTKAYGNAAALPQVTETAFSADENVSKATDGNKNANGGFTGNDMFKLKPVDGSDSVGILMDLQSAQNLSALRLTMTTQSGWMEDRRAAEGCVYTGMDKTALTKAAEFGNGARKPAVTVPLGGQARYVLLMITNPAAIQYDGAVRIYEIELFGSAAPASITRTVSFDYAGADGGDTLPLVTVADGAAVGTLPVPARTGFAFIGWVDDAGALWDAETSVTADVTLRAVWGKNLIPGKATRLFEKVYGDPAALPEVLRTSFEADENVGKATDGSTDASGGFTGNDMFKLKPVDGYGSVGFLVDLQAVTEVNELRLTMTTQTGWMEGNRAARGYVYTSENGADWDAGTAFDNSARAAVIRVSLTGMARYVMAVITNPDAIQFGGAVRIYETELFGPSAACTVTLDYAGADGGTAETVRTVERGDALGFLPTPTKTGCLFLGWYDENNNRVTAEQSVYISMTITARFTAVSSEVKNLIAGRDAAKAVADRATLPAFQRTAFAATEYYSKVTDGDTAGSGGFLSTNILALTGEDGKDTVGLLYDLGAVHSLYTYTLYLCPDNEVSGNGWKKSLRNVAGVIYAGTTQTNLQPMAAFDNGGALEAVLRDSFAGEAARYVLILFTRCNTAGGTIPANRAYLYELEIYGEKRKPAADECLVTFNYGEDIFSGSGEESRIVRQGAAVGELPAPVRIGYVLEGWYSNLNDPDSRVTANTVMQRTTVLYPKWNAKENLIAGKQGVKVIAPKGQPDKFVLTRFSGDEFSARVTDGKRDGEFLGLHVSNAYDCTAGLLFDLGDIYDVDSVASFQNFSGWNLVRTIRGMQVYAGTSLYDLCDAKNRVASVENNSQLTIYREVAAAARYVVFLFTDPTTDPEGLNGAETGQRYHDSGSVAHIHELEVYGTPSTAAPAPTVQNAILNKDARTYIATEGKFTELEEAVYATGLPGYLTLDYSRLNELDAIKQRLYTMGYSYTFTNLFPEDKAVFLYDLGESTDIKRVKCGYNWFGDPADSQNNQRYWDVYIGEDEATLFRAENCLTGRAVGAESNFVLDVSRRGRYVAFVLTTGERSAHVSTLEVYAGEELPSYTVAFDYQGATSARTESRRVVSEGKRIGTLPIPRKGDLRFLGWALDAAGSQLVDAAYIVSKSCTLYAVWGGILQEETYWYPLEDAATGVQANIRLNGASDAMTTFVRLRVSGAAADDLSTLFTRLGRRYWIHALYGLRMCDMRDNEVDIEGREIAVKLPVPESLRQKTLWVMVLDGDRIERVPAELVDGMLCFTTQRVRTYAIVEPNYDKNAVIETVVYDPAPDGGNGNAGGAASSGGAPDGSSGTTQVVVKRRRVVKKSTGGGFPWVAAGIAVGAAAIGCGAWVLIWKKRKKTGPAQM